MATKKTKKEATGNTVDLCDTILELDSLKRYVQKSMEADTSLDHAILLLLIRSAEEKLLYYQDEYDFQVSQDDVYYVEELIDFIKKKESVPAEATAEA